MFGHFLNSLPLTSGIQAIPISLPSSQSPTSPEISGDPFSQAEINTALEQVKLGKAPSLDRLPLQLWKLPKFRECLKSFCNKTLRPKTTDWGLSGIVPSPKKRNLTIPDNYPIISLTQVAAKIYNRLLNRIRPVVGSLLQPTKMVSARSDQHRLLPSVG